MKPAVENIQLEYLDTKDAKVGGKTFDRWTLRKDVILYGASIEGDDYVTAPLFFSAGDALLHSLNPMFIKDSVGFASPQLPANTKYSKTLRFNSGLRIRVYIVDTQALYYDARGKVRLDCNQLTSANFKINYLLRLPVIKDSKGLAEDQILKTVVSNNVATPNDPSTRQLIRVEALHFCSPGKYLKIQKSFRIDMAKLWTFYANLLSKGYGPNDIRTAAFLGDEQSKATISAFLTDMQTPSAIGGIPKAISSAITAGETLDQLLTKCSTSAINQNVCVSGPFFKLLWTRDVPSINDYFTFGQGDESKLIPTTIKTSMVKGWMFKEDFNPNIGYLDIAYNINYNRFLDINTVIVWMIRKMKTLLSIAKPLEQMTLHRFSDQDLDSFASIAVFDGDDDIKVDLSFRLDAFSIVIRNITGSERSKQQLKVLQQLLQSIIPPLLNQNYKVNPFEHKMENLITLFPANQITKEGIPFNFYLLQLLSSFLRALVTQQDFNFFNFL